MTRERTEGGFATAEAAVVIPSLLLVLGLSVGVVISVGAQLRCLDAARVGAREAARGESDARVRQATLAVAPRGAHVTLRRNGSLLEVEVTAEVSAARLLPSVHVSARADAESETR